MAETKDTRSFNKRLMDAMAEMENPTKSKTANVGKFSYKYESLDQVLEVVRPALTKHGLMLFQSVKWREGVNGYVLETGVFGDDDSRVMDERPFHTCSDAQSEGSWETYTRRYALRTAFGLTGEDDDGAATKQPVKTAQKASGEQYEMLSTLVESLADARGVSTSEVEESVMKSSSVKAYKATSWEKMTYQQAQAAINQLNVWIEKLEPELASEDIPF